MMPRQIPVHFAVLDSPVPQMNRPWGEESPSLFEFGAWIEETARSFPDPATAAAKHIRLQFDTLYVLLDSPDGGNAAERSRSVQPASVYRQQSDAWQFAGLIIDLSKQKHEQTDLKEIVDFVCFVLEDRGFATCPAELADVHAAVPVAIWVILDGSAGHSALAPHLKALRDRIRACGLKTLGYKPRVEPCFDLRSLKVQIGLYFSDIDFADQKKAGP